MQYQSNPQLQLAFDFLQYTNQNVFLTGKAGTGKTTFLHNLKKVSPKRMIVVAPTGVAAINAGGVTIHSFFQISFGPQVPTAPSAPKQTNSAVRRFSQEKINIIRSLDLLVIDEISMVRADLLDAVDEVLRRYKKRQLPFGGVQLLMIGDLQQLAPVVKDEEWEIMKNYYETCYFFSSRALKQSRFVGIELKHIFRQSDQTFIGLLNKVRENNIDADALNLLNSRYIPNFVPADSEGYITLTTHNYQAHQINESKLSQLKSRTHWFEADIEGEFPEYSFPTDQHLVLKEGAQVMFVKNDASFEKRYFNGKIGKVKSISEETVEVICPSETYPIKVGRDIWESTKYTLNETTQEIEEEVIGKFVQYPLKLAWAITIHKSQGLTFEKAIIEARLSFAHGQVYVALSRCKTIEGMVLSSPIAPHSVKSDNTVVRFTSDVENNQPGQAELETSKKEYQQQLISELFDFELLVRLVQNGIKEWNIEAKSLMGNLGGNLASMVVPIKEEMIFVAEKFQKQVVQYFAQNTDACQNEELQERIRNGCNYFLSKLETIVNGPLVHSAFQTDNKAIRKTISEALEKITKEAESKKTILSEMSKGFTTQSYLHTRAVAAIEGPATKAKTKASVADLAQTEHPDFFKQLIAWRSEKAEELETEIARILRQDTLAEIANTVPATTADLKAIKGMGGTKMKQFGKELLQLSLNYRKEQGMDIPLGAENEIKKAGLNTKQVSLEMIKSGKTIEEVAAERGFAVSTIEGHLAPFVASGELDIMQVVDKEKFKAIFNYLESNPQKQLTEIKTALGDQYSYGEIKLVTAHAKYFEG